MLHKPIAAIVSAVAIFIALVDVFTGSQMMIL